MRNTTSGICRGIAGTELGAERRLSLILMCAIVALFVFTAWSSNYLLARADSIAVSSLRQRVSSSSLLINPDDVVALVDSGFSESVPAFQSVRQSLISLKQASSDCRFVYLLYLDHGIVRFLVDSEPETSKDYSPPGESYLSATPQLLAAFETGESFVEGPITDKWGVWISGHSAIKHPQTSKIVALLGMDVSAETWPVTGALRHWQGITATAIAILALILLVWKTQRHTQERLHYLATHDMLTGVPNRYVLDSALAKYIGMAEAGSPGALMMIDVDDYKLVNDSLGHQIGDKMLVALTEGLRNNIREGDLLIRLGGDEFCVLLQNTPMDAALAIAERLRSVARWACKSITKLITPTICVGVAPIDGRLSAKRVMSLADSALYDAKKGGKDRVICASASTPEHESHEVETILELIQESLEKGSLVLHVQPMVSVSNGETECYEALIRLPDPSGKLLAPAEFLPVAERFGFMPRIDLWVVKAALGLLERTAWRCLFVNLSATSLGAAGFLEQTKEIVLKSKIPPNRIGFEVTESAAIADLGSVGSWMTDMAKMGCWFALDDFCSGYSSFGYLNDLPFTHVKIDGSFVRSMPTRPTSALLVRAMATAAKSIGKIVVAEFVESEVTLSAVKEAGVDWVQGFHMGAPAPAPENKLAITHAEAAPVFIMNQD